MLVKIRGLELGLSRLSSKRFSSNWNLRFPRMLSVKLELLALVPGATFLASGSASVRR